MDKMIDGFGNVSISRATTRHRLMVDVIVWKLDEKLGAADMTERYARGQFARFVAQSGWESEALPAVAADSSADELVKAYAAWNDLPADVYEAWKAALSKVDAPLSPPVQQPGEKKA